MNLINTLPDHIFIQIFGYLTPNMIKCSALVCKRWNEIIGNSVEIMRRFRLNSKKGEKSKRKYQAVKISHKSTLDVKIGHKLQSLELKYAHNIKLSKFIGVINELYSLKFLAVDLEDPIDDVSSSVNFQKVETNLEELDCSLDISHIFGCKMIKKMKVYSKFQVSVDKMAIDFLKQQSILEDLTYKDFWNEFSKLPEIFEPNFLALKRLSLDFNNGYEDFPNHELIIGFLDRHKKSLTCLELQISKEFRSAYQIKLINDFVLNNLVNLKHIEFANVRFDDIDDENIFSEFLSPTQVTRNIESVMVNIDTIENINQFYALFPNLKHLNMDNATFYPSTTISDNLETLSFWNLKEDSSSMNFSNFPNLKEISIHGELYENDLIDFINRHSNTLEKVTIMECDEVSYETTKAILNCANLKYLELYFGNVNRFIVGLLNEIELKSTRFTLKICHSSYGKHTFVFPDDKAIWDEKVESLELKLLGYKCSVQ